MRTNRTFSKIPRLGSKRRRMRPMPKTWKLLPSLTSSEGHLQGTRWAGPRPPTRRESHTTTTRRLVSRFRPHRGEKDGSARHAGGKPMDDERCHVETLALAKVACVLQPSYRLHVEGGAGCTFLPQRQGNRRISTEHDQGCTAIYCQVQKARKYLIAGRGMHKGTVGHPA